MFLKKLFPGASDEQILQGYKQSNGVKPEQEASFMKDGASMAATPIPKDAPQQVTITGKTPNDGAAIAALPTLPLQNSGTAAPLQTAAPTDQMFAGSGPTAQLLGAQDPRILAQAQALANQRNNVGNNWTQFGNAAQAAVSEGLGGNKGAMAANQKHQEELNSSEATQAGARAAGAREALTSAGSALTTNTNANATANKLAMDKAAFLQDYQTKGLSLEQAQTAWDSVGRTQYDPHSTSSVISQRMAEQMMGLPKGSLDGHSAAQINAEVQSFKPATEIQKQFYDQLIAKMNADSNRMLASANAGATNLGTRLVSAATQGGTVVPPGMNLSVGAGPASITPSPAVTGTQSGAADQVVGLRKGVNAYETGGVGTSTNTAMSSLRAASLIDTGIPGKYLSKIGPAQAAQLRTTLIGQQMAQNPGMKPEEAAGAADALLKSSTPGTLMQQLAIGQANYLANKQAHLPAQEAYLKDHGSLQGFTPPVVGKFWNPKTGKVVISTEPAKDGPALEKSGFKPITGAQ
jgi:hypothetical protein